MSNFDKIIQLIKESDYATKINLMEYLLHGIEQIPGLYPEDRDALRAFADEQAEALPGIIEQVKKYKEKDSVCIFAERILALVTKLYRSKNDIAEDKLARFNALSKRIDESRPIETTAQLIFSGDKIYGGHIDRLISFSRAADDEYQKGKLYAALIQNRNKLAEIDEGSRAKITAYLNEELGRYISIEQPDDDLLSAWEMAVDLVKDLHNDKSAALLAETLSAGHPNVNYYALESLIALGANIPRECVKQLAENLEYANLTYLLLKKHGMTELFPTERSSEEYLAKSDLVHWLIYPTELGKAPDEIEYLGKVKKAFRKEEYFVFRYRSDSNNLDEAHRGKWLVGWSSAEGGTFSKFDLYSAYEKETADKTLKNINKHLIG